ncbi:hypothetical protein GCM10027085_51220 [Spirosoma aerophilum]
MITAYKLDFKLINPLFTLATVQAPYPLNLTAETRSSKVTIHMVSSLDGFVANKDNNVSGFKTTD